MPLTKSRPSPVGVPMELTIRYTLLRLPPMAVLRARCGEERVSESMFEASGEQHTGKACALGVSVKVLPPILKTKLGSFANWAVVRRMSPVFLSSVPPVAR